MNPFLLAFIRGATFRGANSAYTRVLYSALGAVAAQAITIASGQELFVDANTVALGDVEIAPGGKLTFDPSKSVTFTAKSVTNEATAWWTIAAADGWNPYVHNADIILTGARTTHTARPANPDNGINQGYTNDGSSRSINNHGTRFFRGVAKLLPKTKLADNVAAGAISAKLRGDCSDYAVGNDIVIAPTNLYGQSQSERRTLTAVDAYDSVNGWTIVHWSSSAPLLEAHFGKVQYPIDAAYGVNAMSLSPNVVNGTIGGPNTYTPPDADTPTIFDSSAEVINVSSGNISITCLADTDWTSLGFGATTMDHQGSQYHDEGVRIVRAGQRGALARYGFHSHFLSFADTTSPVTFDLSGAKVKVNWVGHGIAPSEVLLGSATFVRDMYTPAGVNGALAVVLSGSSISKISGTDNYYYGTPITFAAGTGGLPSNIVPGRVYLLCRSTTANYYYVCTEYTENAGAHGGIGWVDSGSGTCNANLSTSNQYVAFTTTGTLAGGLATGNFNKPLAQFFGTRYMVLGSTIDANSFCIDAVPNTGITGSGVHTAAYTHFTADHPECQRIKCVVDTCENRAFVTHGSCGTKTIDCIAYSTKGNAFHNEDGSEERNEYTRNFALKVRNPVISDALKDFESPNPATSAPQLFGSAGHWWSNFNNVFVEQTAADCEGSAIIQAPGPICFDLSALVACSPNKRPVRRWLNNGGHSNNKYGLALNIGIDDQYGKTSGSPSSSIYGNVEANELGFPSNLFEGGFAWKNNQGGYQNVENPAGPFYKSWTMSDNGTGAFQGAMNPATMSATSILMIGTSLLPAKTAEITIDLLGYGAWPIFGNATYHFTLTFTNISYHNFPWVRAMYARGGQQDYGGGAVSWRDLYTMAVGLSRMFSVNNKFNNSHPGHLTRCDRYGGYPVTVTLSGPLVFAPRVNAATGQAEFPFFEGEPIRFVRTSGALPHGGSLGAGIIKDKVYYARNVKHADGTAVDSSNPQGVSCNLSATPTGALLDGTGATQSGRHSAMRLWRSPGVYWVRGMGSTQPDPDGSYVKAKTGTVPSSGYQWVCAYSDMPFFASGARNLALIDPDTTGTDVEGTDGFSFSTSDFFIGMQHLRTDGDASSYGGFEMGMTLTRVTPSTLTPIGEYKIDRMPMDSQGSYFPSNQTSALLNRRGDQTWYTFESGDFPDGTGRYVPSSFVACSLTGAQNPDADMMIGLRISAKPNTVFRSYSLNNPLDTPDPTTGHSVTCTEQTVGADAAAKRAAVAADATGSKWFWDGTFCWVRHRPLGVNFSNGFDTAPNSEPGKAMMEQWIVVKT